MKYIKLISINSFIFFLLIIIFELIFGNWFNPNHLDQLNIIRNRVINYKANELYPANFEMTHTTIIRVEESAVNEKELKKIFLSDVPTEMYPEIETKFFEIVKTIGYPDIKLEKKIKLCNPENIPN